MRGNGERRVELPAYLASNETVIDLLTTTMKTLASAPALADKPAVEVRPQLDALLKRPSTMRDGILILLAYVVASGKPLDFRVLPKFPGARAVSQYVADDLLPELGIACTKDAFQTGVKGLTTYFGRENPTWRHVLGWASDQDTAAPVERAFRYLASGIAATARDLPPKPVLDTPQLTFAHAFAALDQLLSEGSKGTYEQLVFAALLESYVNQLGRPGSIYTKGIYASDASAGTAADVQHKLGNEVLQAYEVTSADWHVKVKQARNALASNDLRRIHVLGTNVAHTSGDDLLAELAGQPDIAVLELREEIRSLVARLDKPHRREAFELLYEHLVTKQSDDALVHRYLRVLTDRGLTQRS